MVDMSNISTTAPPASKPIDLIPQIMAAIIGGIIIFTLLLTAVAIGYNISFSGKILPGVNVAGVDVSGLEPAAAAQKLQNELGFPTQGKILFRDGEKIWLSSPAEVGFYFNPQASAAEAYQYGRVGGPLTRISDQFRSWYVGVSLPPMYVLNENIAQSYLNGIAAQTDTPKVDASISIDGSEIVVHPSQTGRQLNIPETIANLGPQLQSMQDGEVQLVINEETPAIVKVDQQVQVASQILSEPLRLVITSPREGEQDHWTFEKDYLAQLIKFDKIEIPEGESYQVGLETAGFRSFLEGIAPQLVVDRKNARLMFNDDSRQLEVIEPAVTGRALNIAASVETISEKLLAGEHEIPLIIDVVEPDVGDKATAEQLGITELVSSHTSYFYGSSAARIQNITTAAAQFHGLLIPPGAVFSMGDVLGEVSLDTGYAEALIIYGDRTIEGVGGGVCQVSTTLFRTVFFGGYPVNERYPHAYRVGYYELKADGGYNTSLAGLDATVYTPLVDFKFTNDSPNWLLMETYVNQAARTLTWKFYSTSDGRTVEWNTSGLQNKVDPPDPNYIENPELNKGEVVQVDWAVEGADVTISRTVTRNSEILFEDTFTTHYMPWREVWEYGPGTKNMPPKEDKKKKNDG